MHTTLMIAIHRNIFCNIINIRIYRKSPPLRASFLSLFLHPNVIDSVPRNSFCPSVITNLIIFSGLFVQFTLPSNLSFISKCLLYKFLIYLFFLQPCYFFNFTYSHIIIIIAEPYNAYISYIIL